MLPLSVPGWFPVARLGVAAAFFVAMLAVAAFPARAEREPGDPWLEQCAKCHGDDGRAQTRVGQKLSIPSLVGSRWAEESADAMCEALRADETHAPALKKIDPGSLVAACVRAKELAAGG